MRFEKSQNHSLAVSRSAHYQKKSRPWQRLRLFGWGEGGPGAGEKATSWPAAPGWAGHPPGGGGSAIKKALEATPPPGRSPPAVGERHLERSLAPAVPPRPSGAGARTYSEKKTGGVGGIAGEKALKRCNRENMCKKYTGLCRIMRN